MKIKKLEALRKQAQIIVDSDPELKSLQEKFKRFGCTETESLGVTLGRAFSQAQKTNRPQAHA